MGSPKLIHGARAVDSSEVSGDVDDVLEVNLTHPDSCPIVFCQVDQVPLHAVVDTGATKTIISEETFRQMKKPMAINKVVNMKLAGKDQSLQAKRIGPVEIKLHNNITFQTMVYVAPIEDAMLMGMDTLTFLKAKLDAGEFKMTIGDHTLPLKEKRQVWDRGKADTDKVRRVKELRKGYEEVKPTPLVLKEKVLIPAKSEVVTSIPMKMQGIPCSQYIWLEPNRNLQVMVSSLVFKGYGLPVVSFINHEERKITLEKGTQIGILHPIPEEDILDGDPTPQVRQVRKESGTSGLGSSNELPEKLKGMLDRVDLQGESKQKFKELLLEYEDVFAESDFDLGTFTAVQHEIDTGDAAPVKLGMRRTPIHFTGDEDKLLEGMMESGVIDHSTSSWGAAPVLVRKKDGSVRWCIDYRALNKLTKKDVYPLPLMIECMDALEGNQ